MQGGIRIVNQGAALYAKKIYCDEIGVGNMKTESYTETNVGKRRTNNEDNYFVNGIYKKDTDKLNDVASEQNTDGTNLFAVCDGMGGEEYGEKASLIAVSTLEEYYKTEFSENISEYIKTANQKICDLILEHNGQRSGTTFAALYIDKDRANVYNVGDSRVYILRNNKLKQLSCDHTRIQQMLNMGIVSPEEAMRHKDRHVLTQHLGIFEDELIVSEYKMENIKIKNGDVFLLCSDGLTDMLTDNEIQQIMNGERTAKKIGDKLINAALDKGGKDNVTIQIVRCISDKRRKKWTFGIAVALIIGIMTIIMAQINIAEHFNYKNENNNLPDAPKMNDGRKVERNDKNGY